MTAQTKHAGKHSAHQRRRFATHAVTAQCAGENSNTNLGILWKKDENLENFVVHEVSGFPMVKP
jgi:hypothetical protein